jgi:hypothetical protein
MSEITDFADIYQEIARKTSPEIAVEIHRLFKGQQIIFPKKLYKKEYIYSYIKHSALDNTHKLALRIRRLLKMKPSEDTVTRLGFIILYEADMTHLRIEILLRKRFEEIASMITENAWFEYYHARYICLNYIHLLKF